MKTLSSFVLALSIIYCCTTSKSVRSEPSLKDHLDAIVNMWEGQYNNENQIEKIRKQGGDIWRIDDTGEGGFLEVTSHYIRLDRPDIGDHVLYVEEYRDEMPSETYRQRIYTIDIDSTNQIRVKMWPFKDKKKYVGSWKNRSLLNELTSEEISAYPDICDLIVKPMEGSYYMYMNGSDCTFGTKTFNYEVMLKKDVFSYRDKITDQKEGTVTSAGAFAYHNLNRVK